ncbi:MAG: hypothetical protein KIS92_09925 [Planctomycetota bacterium]|nr:hypothetical protein [Planctomycetota bacterium]
MIKPKRYIAGLLAFALVALAGGPVLFAGGPYSLPNFTLKDPSDKEHTKDEIMKAVNKGLVVIVTIPNAKHGTPQSRWQSKLMKKDWPEDKFYMLMVEDLSQSGAVKDKALDGMKKGFKPEKQPLLLIDYTGETRKSFGVAQDETVVLVFDKEGKLIHFEDEQSTNDVSQPTVEAVQRVQKAIAKMTK